MMHLYSPGPRWLAVPGIGFPQNISKKGFPVAYLAHMLQRTFPAGFIAPCGCIPQSLWWRMLDLSGKPDAPAVKCEAEDWGK
jgi:hypothetical protein